MARRNRMRRPVEHEFQHYQRGGNMGNTSQQIQSTHWMITTYLTNPPLKDRVTSEVRYLIYQKEKCPRTGREHFQGYLELKKKKTIKGVKNIFGEDCYVLPRRGSREQARDYVRKEDSRIDGPWEVGDFGAGGQGARNDLRGAYDMVKENKKEKEILEALPSTFIRNYRGLREARRILTVPRHKKTRYIFFHYF
jgi:hypothetical protein